MEASIIARCPWSRGSGSRRACHAARIRSWPISPRSRAPTWSSATPGSSTIFRMSSSSACRSSPPRARSASISVSRARAADSRPDSAWSNSSSDSSSTSTADCVIRVSRIGYRRAGSRRARCCGVSRRPTPARNRRRPAGSTDRSSVSASSPRVGQLLQLVLHRRRGRRDRPGPEPGQPRAAEHRIDRQHLVQLGLPPRAEQRGDPRPGLLAGSARPRHPPAAGFPRGRDALQDLHDARPDQPGRGQVLTGLPEQQLWRVVLHLPREQELLQLLPARAVDRPPPQVSGDLAQVIGAGLLTGTVPAQRADRDARILSRILDRTGSRSSGPRRGSPTPTRRLWSSTVRERSS